jgi:hypothetical protein
MRHLLSYEEICTSDIGVIDRGQNRQIVCQKPASLVICSTVEFKGIRVTRKCNREIKKWNWREKGRRVKHEHHAGIHSDFMCIFCFGIISGFITALLKVKTNRSFVVAHVTLLSERKNLCRDLPRLYQSEFLSEKLSVRSGKETNILWDVP